MTMDEIIERVTSWAEMVSGDQDSSQDEIDASRDELRRVVEAIRALATESEAAED